MATEVGNAQELLMAAGLAHAPLCSGGLPWASKHGQADERCRWKQECNEWTDGSWQHSASAGITAESVQLLLQGDGAAISCLHMCAAKPASARPPHRCPPPSGHCPSSPLPPASCLGLSRLFLSHTLMLGGTHTGQHKPAPRGRWAAEAGAPQPPPRLIGAGTWAAQIQLPRWPLRGASSPRRA